jgi:predicted DsbA family dithiol-disulfide isomerase
MKVGKENGRNKKAKTDEYQYFHKENRWNPKKEVLNLKRERQLKSKIKISNEFENKQVNKQKKNEKMNAPQWWLFA